MDNFGQVETYSGKCISNVTCERQVEILTKVTPYIILLFALLYYLSMAYLGFYHAPVGYYVLGEKERERERERAKDRVCVWFLVHVPMASDSLPPPTP
jgi:hypothetical protein